MQQSMQQDQGVAGVTDEDAQMNQAILNSISAGQPNSNSYEPLDPSQRKREENVPCGLKNIGNTCYLNSLLQSYYNLPNFVKAILEFKDGGEPIIPSRPEAQGSQQISSNP